MDSLIVLLLITGVIGYGLKEMLGLFGKSKDNIVSNNELRQIETKVDKLLRRFNTINERMSVLENRLHDIEAGNPKLITPPAEVIQLKKADDEKPVSILQTIQEINRSRTTQPVHFEESDLIRQSEERDSHAKRESQKKSEKSPGATSPTPSETIPDSYPTALTANLPHTIQPPKPDKSKRSKSPKEPIPVVPVLIQEQPAPVTDFIGSPITSDSKTEPFFARFGIDFDTIDWANFLGVKLFAWIGGFTFFLGMVYFVGLSIQNDWISKPMQVAISFLIGLSAIGGGLYLRGRGYPLTVHSLCASGVSINYASIIVAHIPAYMGLGVMTTFGLMVANTIAAFSLAVSLDARFVALLGLVGGFITPHILSTGVDNPFGLFAYIALLNIGLTAVVYRKGWGFLVGLGAIGTLLMEAGWTAKFFTMTKIDTFAAIFVFFAFFFVGVWKLLRNRPLEDEHVTDAAVGVPLISFWSVAFLLSFSESANQSPTVLGLLYSLIIPVVWLVIVSEEPAKIDFPAGVRSWKAEMAWPAALGIVWLLLLLWAGNYMNATLISTGWIAFFILPTLAVSVRFFITYRAQSVLPLPPDIVEKSSSAPPVEGIQTNAPQRTSWIIIQAGRLAPLLSFVLVFFLIRALNPGENPLGVFSLILWYDLLIAAQVVNDAEAHDSHSAASIGSFGLICIWLASRNFTPDNTSSAYILFTGFFAFYFGFQIWAARRGIISRHVSFAGRLSPLLSLFFVGYMFAYPSTGANNAIVFSLMLLFNVALSWQAYKDPEAGSFHIYGMVASFILIWIWIIQSSMLPSDPWIVWAVCLGYPLFYILGWLATLRYGRPTAHITIAARLTPILSMSFVFHMLRFPGLADKPLLVLSLLLALDLLLTLQTLREDSARPFHLAGGGVSFFLLIIWSNSGLTEANLIYGLAFFLLFALVHSALPILLQRMRPEASPYLAGYLLAPLMIVLMFFPIVGQASVSFLLWPAILLVNIVALAAAWMMSWLWAGITMLLLTMGALGFWAQRLSSIHELPGFTGIEIFFTLAFHAWGWFAASGRSPDWKNPASIWRLISGIEADRAIEKCESMIYTWQTPFQRPELLVERALEKIAESFNFSSDGRSETTEASTPASPRPAATQDAFIPRPEMLLMPTLSAFMPFALLLMVVQKLSDVSPLAIFGPALLLTLLLLRMVRILAIDVIALITLISVSLLEIAWQTNCFHATDAVSATGWYLLFFTVFFAFPFLYRSTFKDRLMPWVVSAVSGPVQFYLLYLAICGGWGKSFIGLLPALMAVPALMGLKKLIHTIPESSPLRTTLLALFGGVALFFITFIFPVQFDREWLTVGWALEGAALIWLFRRVPHDGLKILGSALLLIAFIRLGLNEEVFSYYTRSGTPLFNWFLYAYTTVAASLIAGGYFLEPQRDRLLDWRLPPIFYALAGLLLFMLLNTEIADYFSTGTIITFDVFSEDLGRSMTYSLGWSLFALGLLVVGIRTGTSGAIQCSLGLLIVTIAKVFLYDLWRLSGLYKVASLIGLAGALMLVSFLYQHFLGRKPDDH
ncbi:MAG: DUF2339 domain-containing protein [Candidatus Riflebacteria bacterium]|nr:DUF2339 domain-containing protein [Candidatus Riflebacteria bacterium]